MITERLKTRTEEWTERMSIARGTIYPEVEKYARMRMTPREILIALEYEQKDVVSLLKVENALNKAWKRNRLEKRTKRETALNRTESVSLSDLDVRARVPFWIRAARAADRRRSPYLLEKNLWLNLIAAEEKRENNLLTALLGENLLPESLLEKSYLIDYFNSFDQKSEIPMSFYHKTNPLIQINLSKQKNIISSSMV